MHWYIKGCVVDDIIDRANYICSAARQITAIFITRWVERGVKYFIRFHDFTIFRGGVHIFWHIVGIMITLDHCDYMSVL